VENSYKNGDDDVSLETNSFPLINNNKNVLYSLLTLKILRKNIYVIIRLKKVYVKNRENKHV
jgi:hypothetical protein